VSQILKVHLGAPVSEPANSGLLNSEFSSKDLKSVGNYTLGRLIGKGSFGKVYLATHKLTNGSKVGHAGVAHVETRRSSLLRRSCSSPPTRATRILPERSTTTDNSSILISHGYTRSL
jgi:serine/threonine protein kinase